VFLTVGLGGAFERTARDAGGGMYEPGGIMTEGLCECSGGTTTLGGVAAGLGGAVGGIAGGTRRCDGIFTLGTAGGILTLGMEASVGSIVSG
jgi:hypothetical protein